MTLMDDVMNKAMATIAGGGSDPMVAGVLEMIQNHPGGLSGLVQTFHDKGLGELISSWTGTGSNLPISADQIHQVLGSQTVQALAAKAGIPADAAGSSLAQILPSLIDKLTPNGEVPAHSNVLQMGLNLLKSLGKTGTDA
ncbi:MAG TPA: YidB family protein [Terriglobales bacterium]|nr:YidB family protein [Terriglobales bacterium]